MNAVKGYVTIIVPCFNGGKYVYRFLDSLLIQSYKKIQLIFVNDGSTDETETVFNEYMGQIIKCNKEFKYKYIKQSNKGQAAAINAALPFVEGEYLMWMDSDDYISPEHVEVKVDFLKKNQEYQMVMCRGRVVDENDIGEVKRYLEYKNISGSLFNDILLEYCGCANALFLVRSFDFFEIFKDGKIYESRIGQNLQMLLPLTYKLKVGHINNCLFSYVERSDSHSHNYNTLQEIDRRIVGVFELKYIIIGKLFEQSMQKVQKLNAILGKRKLQQRIDSLCLFDIKENDRLLAEKIIDGIIQRINMKKSRFLIWGYTEKNIKLREYLLQFGKVTICGFIDSDLQKQNIDCVISPKEINSDDFIIISVKVYSEIINELCKKDLKLDRDYIYIDYEVKKEIKNYDKSWDSDISICR